MLNEIFIFKGYQNSEFNWENYLEETRSEAAPEHLFKKVSSSFDICCGKTPSLAPCRFAMDSKQKYVNDDKMAKTFPRPRRHNSSKFEYD